MASDLDEILKSIDELATRAKLSRQRAFAAWYSINFCDLARPIHVGFAPLLLDAFGHA